MGPRNYPTLAQAAQNPAAAAAAPAASFTPNAGAQFINGNSFDFTSAPNGAYDQNFLNQIRQFDPNAFASETRYGEDGNTSRWDYHYDINKMPKPTVNVSTDARGTGERRLSRTRPGCARAMSSRVRRAPGVGRGAGPAEGGDSTRCCTSRRKTGSLVYCAIPRPCAKGR